MTRMRQTEDGAMSKKHLGSSIDDFLKEEGIYEEAQTRAIKEVVVWQLAQAMKKRKISKNKLATLLKTRRSQVDRGRRPIMSRFTVRAIN
jgi:antitoxin HicB